MLLLYFYFPQSYNNHQQTVSALLDYGADIAITDDQGLTPIEVARTKKMKNLLKEAWTESNRTNNNEITHGSSEEVKKKGGNTTKKKPEVIFDVSYVRDRPQTTCCVLLIFTNRHSWPTHGDMS